MSSDPLALLGNEYDSSTSECSQDTSISSQDESNSKLPVNCIPKNAIVKDKFDKREEKIETKKPKLPSADSILNLKSKSSFSLPLRNKTELSTVPIISKEESKEKFIKRQPEQNHSTEQTQSKELITSKSTRKRVESNAMKTTSNPIKRLNTRKERVKEQRTKGQSGIGENFREWRSETEMKMRQQFD